MKVHIFELRRMIWRYDHSSYAHNLSSCKMKAWKKKSGSNGIRTKDLSDTGAVSADFSFCHFVAELLLKVFKLTFWTVFSEVHPAYTFLFPVGCLANDQNDGDFLFIVISHGLFSAWQLEISYYIYLTKRNLVSTACKKKKPLGEAECEKSCCTSIWRI